MSVARFINDGTETLYSVQYLRAIAAILVVFFHISVLSQETWGLDPDRVDHVGAAGVDLFFVISGFIMAMIVDRPGGFNGRQFWIRRFARVAPAYWVITLFVFALALVMPTLFHSTQASFSHLFVSMAFLAVAVGSDSTAPLMVVGWTLNYELFFYTTVALTAGLFDDRRLIGTSCFIICLVMVGILFRPAHPTLAFYSDPILLEFVFGALIFRAWRQSGWIGANAVCLLVFVTGAVLLAFQWERPLGDWRVYYWGVPAAAVLYGGLGVLRFASPALARLGEWSYALYLTHLFVITFYIKHLISVVYAFDVPWPVHYMIMTASCIAVAAGFHAMVERPLSRWTLRKLSPRREVPDAEPRLSGQSAP